jgi:hypothetical protein
MRAREVRGQRVALLQKSCARTLKSTQCRWDCNNSCFATRYRDPLSPLIASTLRGQCNAGPFQNEHVSLHNTQSKMDTSWSRRDIILSGDRFVRRGHRRTAGAPRRDPHRPCHFDTCRWSGSLIATDGLVFHGDGWSGHRVRRSLHSSRLCDLKNLMFCTAVGLLHTR